MHRNHVPLDTSSPSARPSSWQLRFGKKSVYQVDLQHGTAKPEVEIQARSPSLSDRLLQALDTKPKEQEDISGECVDELLGWRNAFASEPEWRLRNQTRDANDIVVNFEETPGQEIAEEAREIIQARFQLEKQADALRHAQNFRDGSKSRGEKKNLHRIGLTITNSASRIDDRNIPTMPSRSLNKQHVYLEKNNFGNQEVKECLRKKVSQRKQHTQLQHRQKAGAFKSKKRTQICIPPPQQLSMERRQELLLQARKTRKAQVVEEGTLHKLPKPTCDNNEEVSEQQRLVEEKIKRLTLENQHAVALKERLEHRKARLQILKNLFNAWYRLIESKREVEAQVVADYKWRIMMRYVATWKRYTHRRGQTRAVEQSRLKKVDEQQMNERAQEYYRSKRLPVWLYRWMAFVSHQQGHRAAVDAVHRRKVHFQRLIQKQQNKLLKVECDDCQPGMEDFGAQRCDTSSQDTTDRCVNISDGRSTQVTVEQIRRKVQTWTDFKDSKAPQSDGSIVDFSNQKPAKTQLPKCLRRAHKHADKVFDSMEQRAAERKERRLKLKRRYEELEQKKRQEQEEQRAAQENIILEKQLEEKARARERKLAEAVLLKEKRERRAYLSAQWDKALKHDCRRLLFFYAILPWQKHQALIERVARNATRWHELRSVYSHWERWQEFVQICREMRCRHESAQLKKADQLYTRNVKRRAFWRLARHLQAIRSQAHYVWRQSQRSTLEHSWKHWFNCFISKCAYQEKFVFDAMIHMQYFKLRQIFGRWHMATNEAKHQRYIDQEKQLLWRKVRGWLNESD
ncbi:hypothetical protein Plhal304r1_c068g0156091 [Plasmopara halstedii]